MSDSGSIDMQDAGPFTQRFFLVRTPLSVIRNNLIAVGWNRVRFETLPSPKAIKQQINTVYGKHRRNQQAAYFAALRAGDIIVVPLSKSIAFGIVADERLLFDEEAAQNGGLANQRRVNFLRAPDSNRLLLIPREAFKEKFVRRLRAPGLIVNDLTDLEETIREHFQAAQAGQYCSMAEEMEAKLDSRVQAFKKELLKRIRSGNTHLKGGGIGLELLVKELLEVSGYSARILSKQHFRGRADADIHASRTDAFTQVVHHLLIQVKHHQGETGVWGLEQLKKIRGLEGDLYGDYQLMLVTSGRIPSSVSSYAAEHDIQCMDGEGLVDLIHSNLSRLSEETLYSLGISSIPQLLD